MTNGWRNIDGDVGGKWVGGEGPKKSGWSPKQTVGGANEWSL